MRARMLMTVLLLCLVAGIARAAGLRHIEIPAGDGDAAIAGVVWYPCARPTTDITLAHLHVQATPDCPLEKSGLALIVVSHGYGGNYAGHHDTAETLADAGFVVVAINHPIDSTGDTSRADSLAWFTERPRDIKRVIDFMLGSWPDRARLDPQRIGFFGFSRGGYTGLVAIGANPDFRAALPVLCPPARHSPGCDKVRAGAGLPSGFTHDPRIKAAVIADPALPPLFTTDALRPVGVPVQLWASALSGTDPSVGVTVEGVERIADTLPERPDFHLVSNAGHFVFLFPCPPALVPRLPRLCVDPPGFDRAAFHQEFDAAVLAFFRAHLMH